MNGGTAVYSTLDVDVRAHPQRTVVTVAGDLDMDTCPHLSETLEALTLDGQALALDLRAVTFMDSSALHLLLALRNRARATGGTLELIGLPHQAQRLLDLTGTRRLFTLQPCPTL
ncbi:STAS domain-containing protein [Streptomyces sp. NPDC101118]|uniref:STAS domain-containing protein n=1 Tax=Streptomyces sp. NPDC101118 TaxID=3366109 RepID=UPI0037FDFEFC